MEVQVESTGPCSRTLTIRIPPEKVRAHVDELYRNASQQVRIKGFRPGKVPRKVLEKRLGDEIRAEAKETLINRSFQDACRDNELAMVGQPRLEGVGEGPLDTRQPFEFQVHLDVRPEVEIGDIGSIEVKGPRTEPTDEEVDKALQQVADEKKALLPVDEPVAQGDFVKADLVFADAEGNRVHEREGAQLNTGIPVAGTDPEVFAKKLEGAEKGGEVSMELTYPDSFEKEEMRGQEGRVTIRIHEILRVTPPPLDDELAKSFDFEDLGAMREELRNRIRQEKERVERTRMEDEVLTALLAENPFDVPESVIEEQRQHALHSYRHHLEQQGVAQEEIDARVEQAGDEARQEAERKVRAFFLIDAIAKKEKVFVTETDIANQMQALAQAHQVGVEQVEEYFQEHDRMADLRVSILERKVRDFLRENARITDNDG